ncbi:MAG TPA: sterol desaturase family protein [Burkholderiales bacterium]|jgi:sterol desaturase/sphingolipid hydroxylase (fatty acid hydroxylase superfamily)
MGHHLISFGMRHTRQWLLPALIGLALLELLFLAWRGRSPDWRDSAASIVIALGQRFASIAAGLLYGGLYDWSWTHRLYTVPLASWWAVPLLFIATEFFYYWQHRLSHEVRWFWASHAVHHSPVQLNLSAAYRIGWTSGLSGLGLVMLPLVWLGFHPLALFGMLSLNLLYQFWLHTELVPRLPWLDGIFNTPSNHRVHHAVNPRYLDRNYGGVLIVFDRLFCTWVRETVGEPCRYGLTHQVGSYNPLRIVFHEWLGLGRDLMRARSPRAVFGHVLGPPGWREDGSGLTTAALRQQTRAA